MCTSAQATHWRGLRFSLQDQQILSANDQYAGVKFNARLPHKSGSRLTRDSFAGLAVNVDVVHRLLGS